ncbi:hypothetical protein HW555_013506 [Spodoptera exigua]|uniref:C2H2-type domain-containing protein n=1 Tax=Spodoptera exigua TaxID=7107 RepID=A0A835G2T2_SPOEX|nr:hypothetical protein HW555_013506 [Spodoptera exigua]
MQNVQQSVILFKIRTFLTIDISTDSSLPKSLCIQCSNKTTELYQFCISIQENEAKLKSYLNNGCLQEYYSNVTNNRVIEDEKTDIIFCENSFVKTEDPPICQIAGTDNVKNKNMDECLNLKQDDSIDGVPECNYNTIIKQFTCLSCLNSFESRNNLIQHYHNEHLKKEKTSSTVNYSESNLNGVITYSCKSCDRTCNIKKNIVKHIATHVDERPLICKLCGRTYKTVTEIIRHARAHNGFKLECSYKCGYSTAYQGALKEHENRHQKVYKYTCDKCGVGFSVKTWYEQHQNVHTGLKPYVCDICGHTFHMARSWKHPQSSSVKRYVCVHCGHKCDSSNSLALHLEEHGINKEKEFLCDFCGKILARADQLKHHRRMHSGVKPYSCSICNKTFATKFYVKTHMISHSGEKMHSCTGCGKRYTQRSTLLRHLRRHHGGGISPKRPE